MNTTGNHLLRPLFDGPLDVIGDVHGEADALGELLGHLGYDAAGGHAGGRRLVFIGDLCDRGPDSPAVIGQVMRLVAAGRAECLLGNHELNLLRGSRKEGNGWFFADDHDAAAGKFTASRRAAPGERDRIRAFCEARPLVLERADLRLVHAGWDDAAIALLGENRGTTAAIYRFYAERIGEVIRRTGLDARARAEWDQHGERLTDPHAEPPLLEGLGRVDQLYQMGNPVRIVTSGAEMLTQAPFFASGKWRMLDRVKWWHAYRHDTPVVVGHYWRWPSSALRAAFSRGEHDLFDGMAPEAWHGARRNVFCVDFGVGARYKERALGRRAGFQTRLGALRWPERELVWDDGTRLPTH